MNKINSGGAFLPLGDEGDTTTPANQVVSPSSSMALISIEGQEFELERALADDDEILRKVLRPHYSSIENAVITREEKDGRPVVTVLKRAQHKGTAALEADHSFQLQVLMNESETLNPALLLAEELARRSPSRPLSEKEAADAEAVLRFSETEIETLRRWQRNLSHADSVPSVFSPIGFQ